MAQTLFANVDCWLQHMALDENTGLDKPGINLRAATGLEAVDYFVPGYAVWAKMVQALGDIGYDSNTLVSHETTSDTVEPQLLRLCCMSVMHSSLKPCRGLQGHAAKHRSRSTKDTLVS